MDATQTMQDANKIIEDFTIPQFALYFVIFVIETALAFWVALSI